MLDDVIEAACSNGNGGWKAVLVVVAFLAGAYALWYYCGIDLF